MFRALLFVLLFAGPLLADPTLDQLYRLQNAERTSRGLPMLGRGAKMQAVAQAHADWMVATGQFTHFGNGTPWSRLDRAGVKYSAASENIAWGQRDAAEAISDWMGSHVGHRENILGPWTHAGAGVARGRDGRLWWVMTFANQTGAAASVNGQQFLRAAAPTLRADHFVGVNKMVPACAGQCRRGLFGRRR